jgi:hypothetical protein
MSKTEPSTPFTERVQNLLAERAQLRDLCTALARVKWTYDRPKITEAEHRITELVTSPLNLPRGETPAEPHLAAACENLGYLLVQKDHPEFIENPARIFDGLVSVVSGVLVKSWNSALQARLIALCGQMDSTLSAMLEAA